jgi:SAM-dependent methyltransferase
MEMDALGRERGTEPDPDIWRWSPQDIIEFDEMLGVAFNALVRDTGLRQLTFVEAGAGIGTKLYLARHKYNLREWGFEINPDYISRAKALGVRIELRDLRADPRPDWGIYDIVYIARPFKDDAQEVEWEQSVQDAMGRGAVLISAFTARKPYTWKCIYRKPFRGVWIKP